MGLRLNEEKSRQIYAKETPFNFLGFVFIYDRSFMNLHWRRSSGMSNPVKNPTRGYGRKSKQR